MTLFERTKELSKSKGWNLQTTAEKAGLSQNAIYNWKSKEPSKVSLKAVASVLDVSTDYLLGRTDEMHTSHLNEEKNMDIKDALENDIMLAFDGKPISDKYKRIILELLSEEDD